MYSDIAAFDRFFWIFVNKDEGYHWVAIVEASPDLPSLAGLSTKRRCETSKTHSTPTPAGTDHRRDRRRLKRL
ncbi:hypothetical protein M8494_14830 [Serratia ureilytica]